MEMATHPKSNLTAWERWELASFADEPPATVTVTDVAEDVAEPLSEEEQLALIREAARLEAYDLGYKEGLEQGHVEGYSTGKSEGFSAGHAEGLKLGAAEADARGRDEAEKLAKVLVNLEARIEELNQTVADDLLGLTIEIARQVIRQTVGIRPEVLLAVIHEALLQLPVQHAAIHLHPEDASLTRSRAGDQLAHAGHRIHEDPRLKRGDVVIESGGSHIDATLASRWQRVVRALGVETPWVDTPTP